MFAARNLLFTPATSAPPPVTYVAGSYASSGTITPPTHSVGDFLLSIAWRTSSLQPGDPSGWTLVLGGTSGGGVGSRINKKTASATNDAGGVTSFQAQHYLAFSNADTVPSTPTYNSGTGTTPSFPALTLAESGTSKVLRIVWKNGTSDIASQTVAGYSLLRSDTNATSGQLAVFLSNGDNVSSNPTLDALTTPNGGSTQWRTWTIELSRA